MPKAPPTPNPSPPRQGVPAFAAVARGGGWRGLASSSPPPARALSRERWRPRGGEGTGVGGPCCGYNGLFLHVALVYRGPALAYQRPPRMRRRRRAIRCRYVERLKRSGNPEANVVAAEAGWVVEAVSRPEEVCSGVPRAAAQNAGGAVTALPWGSIFGSTLIVRMPVVVAPFPCIAVHIAKPPGIGRKLEDRRRAF
jgi:hypothetical protein